MLRKNPHLFMRHISDEDLVRCADGELPSQRAAELDAHLEACWDCRARMESVQSAMTSFVRAHHADLRGNFLLPPDHVRYFERGWCNWLRSSQLNAGNALFNSALLWQVWRSSAHS